MGASSWEICYEKKRGAPNSKCSASLVTKRYFVKNYVFYAIKLFWKSQHMASRRKLQWKWMSKGHLGRKLPWKWVYRGHLRRKHWKLCTKRSISPELDRWNIISPVAMEWKYSVGDQNTIQKSSKLIHDFSLLNFCVLAYITYHFWAICLGDYFGLENWIEAPMEMNIQMPSERKLPWK